MRRAELIATRDDRGGLGALAEQSIELLATGTATSATTAYSPGITLVMEITGNLEVHGEPGRGSFPEPR